MESQLWRLTCLNGLTTQLLSNLETKPNTTREDWNSPSTGDCFPDCFRSQDYEREQLAKRNHFPASLTKLILLNHDLLSTAAASMAASLCSRSWERHSDSTRESLVCASSNSSSLSRCSESTTLTLVLKVAVWVPSSDTWPSSEKRAAQFSHDPTRLWKGKWWVAICLGSKGWLASVQPE